MKHISVKTTKSRSITATYFEPNHSNGKTVIIAGGVGLPQRFFFNFASFLAEKGCNAYTFDYRDIALSKTMKISKSDSNYKDWAQDFKSVTLFAKESHPNDTLLHVGHSFGGNSLGLSDAYQHFECSLMIGSQYGYYRNFPLNMQLAILAGFGIVAPLSSYTLGYFPAKQLGLGEPLPKQIALDWGTLLLHKRSMLAIADKYEENHYHNIENSMLLISLDDDNFAPKKSVDALADKAFKNAPVERIHILPSDYGLRQIGHNDFFRKKNKEHLWHIATDWFQL
ncbi:hypothetical protein ACFQ1M_08580 [Sungkyunkwania multivorans]|uniref:Alpha/beta hydrolase n=1 Tax=Sungkyunkwania multivorans TaxID=1173618 RepID=A0ABW3CZI5_9FLAO